MKKQKVMSQIKEQDKTQEKQLNEVEIGNLPEKEFRITIVKMIQDLRKSMQKMQDAYQRPRRTKEQTNRDDKYIAAAAAKSLQSCLTLCDPIDGSSPGSPVPGIFQARVLEWGAIAFSGITHCC